MVQPKLILCHCTTILGLTYTIICNVFAMLQCFYEKTIVLVANLRKLNSAHAFANLNCEFTLANTTTEELPAFSSQHSFSNKIGNRSMQKLLRFLCLFLVISVCTYFTSSTSANAQSLPQISLGFTMIDGRVGSTEAVEGEVALFSIQSDRVISRVLEVTVNVSQTGNFISTVRANEPLSNQYTHGVLGVNEVTIAAGRKVAFIGIATNNDQIDEENGTISVLLTKNSSYSVKLDNPSDRQKTINVNDNDDEPVFSLATRYSKVSDSDFFEVDIISNSMSERQYTIDLSISSSLSGLIASSDQSATVNFAPLASVQSHTIRVAADTATDTDDGHPVTVVINSSVLYTVDHSKRQVQVNIVDGDSLPTPSISAGSSTINEGEPAVFNIGLPTSTPSKTINVALASEGNYLEGQTSDTIVIPASTTSFKYAIPTIRNSGTGGSITLTLKPGDGYKLPTQSSRTVTIATSGSTQTPVMYISNKSEIINNDVENLRVINSASVGSSGHAEFTVFSNFDHGSSAVSVSYLPTNLVGDFLGTTKDNIQTGMVTFSAVTNSSPPLFSGALRVPIVQDPNTNRKSGVIQVTLLDPTGSTYSVLKYQNQVTMHVAKVASSLPVISITGGGRFEEGQDGIFYLHADRTPSSAITVTVVISGGTDFLSATNTGTKTVEISSTIPVPLSIPTVADSTDESDGTVTATIQADPAMTDTYEVSVNSSATITIVDNDNATNIPKVEIEPRTAIDEGEIATFPITATPHPSQPLLVYIDILLEGDMFENVRGSELIQKTITIPTSGEFIFNQQTIADAIVEDSGKITVTVRANSSDPTSYSVGSTFKHEITVNDDDIADTPGVSVIAGGDIVEGENAFFTFRTNKPIDVDLPVKFSYSRTGTFFEESGNIIETVILPAYPADSKLSSQSSAYIFHVPTRYDEEDEVDGKIFISLLNHSGQTPRYSVGASPFATVVVKDDDLPGPVIGIRSTHTETGVTINKPITFTVFSRLKVQQDTTITIEVQKIGQHTPNFADSNSLQNNQKELTIKSGEALVHSTIFFENCATCPTNFTSGRYVITIVDKSDYSVNPTQNKVEIDIKNNDPNRATLPIISIAPSSSQPILAGGIARYTFTSDKPLTEHLEINYWTFHQRTFFSDVISGGSANFTFYAGTSAPYTQILEIQAPATDENFDPFSIPVILMDGRGYAIGPNSVARVKVNNLSISIKTLTEEVIEGGAVLFAFTTNKAVPAPVTANIRVTDPGNYLSDESRNRTQVELHAGLDARLREFYLSLTTELNNAITDPNTIKVEILPGEGYQVGTTSAAEVPVRDGNVKISVVPLSAEVRKGSLAHFRIHANLRNLTPAPSVTVKLGIVGNPSSIHTATNQEETMTLSNSWNFKDISIMVAADSNMDYELAGVLTVYVKNPDGRTEESFSLPKDRSIHSDYVAVMEVIDDDVPAGISILPLTKSIIEGEVAEFQITADSVSSSQDRTINLLGSRDVPSTIVLPYSHLSVVLRIPTRNNPVQQPPGSVVVSIDSGSGYTAATNYDSASVVILDAIVPKFKLLNSQLRVEKGQQFDVTILADPVPQVNYNVNLYYFGSENIYNPSPPNKVAFGSLSHTFMADESSLTFSGRLPVGIRNSESDNPQYWTIVIEPADPIRGRGRANLELPIFSKKSYQVTNSAQSEVSIVPLSPTDRDGNPSISEGSVAQYEIKIDYGKTTIITETGIVHEDTPPHPILVRFQLIAVGPVLPALNQPPNPEDYSDRHGVLNNELFNAAVEAYKELQPTFLSTPLSSEYYVDDQGQIDNNELEAALNAYRAAQISVHDCDRDFDKLIFSCWVKNSRTFNIPTISSRFTRSLEMRILPGTGDVLSNYRIEDSKSSAIVKVIDPELPVITVSTLPTHESGGALNITFHAEPTLTKNITVTFEVDDPAGLLIYGDSVNYGFHFGYNRRNSPFVARMYNTDDELVVDIGTRKDTSNFLPDGLVTVRILPDPDYIVGPTTGADNTKSSVTSTLIYHTNSPPGGISIIAPDGMIKSGETAVFNIKRTSQMGFNEDTMIPVVISQDGSDVIAGPRNLTRQVLIPKGDYSGFLRLDTMDLPYSSGSRTITATLQSDPDNNYTLTTNTNYRSASITVNLSSKFPIASVENSNDNSTISEGEIAYFNITIELPQSLGNYQPPEDGFNIFYNVTSTGGNFLQTDDATDYSRPQKYNIAELDFQPHWDSAKPRSNRCIYGPSIYYDVCDEINDQDKINRRTTFTIPIRTQVDKGLNNGGRVSVTLLDDPSNPVNYELSNSDSTAYVDLNNNHASTPEISISKGIDPTTNQQVDTITEGGEVRAVVTINPSSGYRFVLKLKATENGDFLNVGRNGKNIYIEFAARVNKQEFNFDIFDDDVEEDNGTVTLTIEEQESYNVGSNNSVTFSVMDNDDPPIIGLNSTGSIQEGSLNTGPVLTLSNPTTKVVEYSFYTVEGSATSPADFTGALMSEPATGYIPIGHTSASVPIPIIEDYTNEQSENFRVRLTDVTNASFTSGVTTLESTITINDGDAIGFNIEDSSVNEGNTGTTAMNFDVTLTEAVNRAVSVNWGTYFFEIADTATPVEDFVMVPSTKLEFAPGETRKEVTVMIVGDTEKELHETFTVGLTNPSSGVGIAKDTAVGTIVSDDAPLLEIASGTSVIEADGAMATFTISATRESPNALITVYYNLTESGDFIDIEGNDKQVMLDFSNGVTQTTLSIPIVNDLIQESEGTITVTLIADKANPIIYFVPPNSEASVRVIDDDTPTSTILPTISILANSGEVAESAGSAKFILNATGVTVTSPASLVIRATPAEDGHDFLTDAVAGKEANFPVLFHDRGNGIYSGELSVALDDDDKGEATGQIKLTLKPQSGIQSYLLGARTGGVITIWDDDAPELKITSATPVLDPEDGVATFRISALVSPEKSVRVYYTVTETSSGNGDYLALTEEGDKDKLLDFSSGKTSAEISIPIFNDMTSEGISTISIKLTADQSAVLIAEKNYLVSASQNMASIQVIDDVNPVIIVTAGSSVTEGTPATFIFSPTANITLPVDVQFTVQLEGDFTLWRIPRVFLLTEENRGVLRITTHDDEIYEPDDGSITITLVPVPSVYTILPDNSATVMIEDNDLAPDDPNRPEPEPRISIANTAVDAIINFLQETNSGSAPNGERSAVLPTVSIHATNPQVEEGSPAEFTLSSTNLSESSDITVKLSLNPVGDFFEFVEATQTSIRLQGTDSIPLIYQTIDDTIAENDGRLEVSIIVNSSYQIANTQSSAVVIISDAIDRTARQDLLSASAEAFLPDVVGNMAARTSEIIAQRVEQGFSDSSEVILNLGGEETLKGLIELSGEITNKGEVSWRELLGDSAFAMTILSGEDVVTPTTIWGIGDHRDLTSNASNHAHDWTGDTFTGHIGIDTLIGEEILTGVTASFAENDIEIDGNHDHEFDFTLNSTSLNPFIGWTSTNQNAELRAVAGYGVGELTIDQSDYSREALASKSYSLVLAGRKELYSSDTILNGITKLSIIGDSWFARQYVNGQDDLITNLQTDAQYYNVRTEGTYQYEFTGGSSLSPLISVGIRKDTKNQLSTQAIEFTGGLDYDTPIGLTVTSSGHLLVADENSIQKMSVRSTLGYDRGNDDLGVTITVSPKWGHTLASAQHTLWNSNILTNNNEIGQYTNGTQINSKVGYGFVLGEHTQTLTVYSGYEFDDQTEDELLLGSRVAIGSNFGLDFEGTRKISTRRDEASKLQLNGRLSW